MQIGWRDFLAMLSALLATSAIACGQANQRAIFVSNNGNLEGSVSAFTVNSDGTLSFVNRIVTGTRTSTSQPCAGCNAYEISITPNGAHVASAHAAGDLDGITIFRVGGDGSIQQLLQVPLAVGDGTPLDLIWMDNQYLAFTRTDANPDELVIARFNPAGPSLTELTWTPANTNSVGYLTKHPILPVLYANDSAQRVVRAYSLDTTNGALTLIDTESSGTPFPLELAISPNGQWLYAAGGISDGGNKVVGFNVNADGTLTLMSGSPFVSPGASPSNVWVSRDNRYLVTGHGTDATVRMFIIDQSTGALTATANMFDVGGQGTLGDVHMLGDFMFVTDNSTSLDGLMGIYSFTVGAGASLTQNAPIYSTQGIAPRSIASWQPPSPPCPNDVTGDSIVNVNDLLAIINGWGPCPGKCPPTDQCPADVTGDCVVNVNDLLSVINGWGPCPL